MLRLQSNIRAQNCSTEFRELLMQIGDGTYPVVENDLIRIPDQMVVEWEEGEDEATAMQRLIDAIYPSLDQNAKQEGFLINRAILASKHEHVYKINSRIMEAFPGEEVVYHSFDSVVDDVHDLYPTEYLNTLTPAGMAPHELKLKVGCPIMCLRNLDPTNGLCNGTRLLCRVFHRNVIDAEIATGYHRGRRVFIPRIPMMPSANARLPFELLRKQFPVVPAFGLTINKSQGQTIPVAGLFLPEPVFSHGQLYVALSRGVSTENVKVLIKDGRIEGMMGCYTKNVVYREVLQ